MEASSWLLPVAERQAGRRVIGQSRNLECATQLLAENYVSYELPKRYTLKLASYYMNGSHTNDVSERGVVVPAQIERPPADERAFLEAHRLLVVFAVSAVPALLLVAFNVDLYEGDFGPVAAVLMIASGSIPVICTVASVWSRRLWKMGNPLNIVLRVLYGLPLLLLVIQFAALMAWTGVFSSAIGRE
jgi:hypothetical protein